MGKYTKGDKNEVLTRISQVSDITVNVPYGERCVDYLYDSLMTLCYHYIDDDDGDRFLLIPAIDFYNVVIFVNKCCEEKNIGSEYISAMMGIVGTFSNLKYITIRFSDDDELKQSYVKLINAESNNGDLINELSNIYSINALSIYLGDMFDQDIVDLLNKHFMSNGIIPNSYLEREFLIMFNFDEYISYMNMFVDNNIDRLSMCDIDIIDYLRVFPNIIGDMSKPCIMLYTNYREI